MTSQSSMEKRSKFLVQFHRERMQLLLNARSYQRRITEKWNPKHNALTPLLLLPETPFDDMTRMGNGGILLQFMLQFGLLVNKY
jgi:hypothetical protein